METQQVEAAFRVSNLIIHYLRGNMPAHEQAALESWINASEENKALFETLVSPERISYLLSDFSQKNKRKKTAHKKLLRKLFSRPGKVKRLTARLWRYVA